ncbi:MAG: AmmeMemoRadiSam system protein A [Bacillota bacterium]
MGNPFVKLARETVEEYVLHGRVMEPPAKLDPRLREKAGVFVTIKKNGDLRGCIGTTSPTRDNIAQEIIANALSASQKDPRFPPVQAEELDQLRFSVDILGESEQVESLAELDPQTYGVIVEKGQRSGLLLPDLEGIDTPEEQVEIACKKAGIPSGSDLELYRFRVDRYEE